MRISLNKFAVPAISLASNDINYVDTSSAYENAGLCAMKIPNKRLAEFYFNKTLQTDPDRTSVLIDLALLKYQNKEYPKSKYYLEQFLMRAEPTKDSRYLSEKLGI